jgi:phosphoserine phosphatase
MQPRKPKLVSFDLDGTLIRGTTVCLEMGRLLGHLDKIRDLEARYARSEISNTEVASQDALAYRDRSVSDIEQAVLGIPLIEGFAEVVAALKQQGVHVLLVTVTMSLAARAIARKYGLDGYAGAEMGEINGRLTGQVAAHFEERDKVRFVQEYGRKFGINLSKCAAIGDSRSDIPLFKEVGLAIALNATPQARAASHDSRYRQPAGYPALPYMIFEHATFIVPNGHPAPRRESRASPQTQPLATSPPLW